MYKYHLKMNDIYLERLMWGHLNYYNIVIYV